MLRSHCFVPFSLTSTDELFVLSYSGSFWEAFIPTVNELITNTKELQPSVCQIPMYREDRSGTKQHFGDIWETEGTEEL